MVGASGGIKADKYLTQKKREEEKRASLKKIGKTLKNSSGKYKQDTSMGCDTKNLSKIGSSVKNKVEDYAAKGTKALGGGVIGGAGGHVVGNHFGGERGRKTGAAIGGLYGAYKSHNSDGLTGKALSTLGGGVAGSRSSAEVAAKSVNDDDKTRAMAGIGGLLMGGKAGYDLESNRQKNKEKNVNY